MTESFLLGEKQRVRVEGKVRASCTAKRGQESGSCIHATLRRQSRGAKRQAAAGSGNLQHAPSCLASRYLQDAAANDAAATMAFQACLRAVKL